MKRKDCHLSAKGLYFPLRLWWHPIAFSHEGSKANGKTSHSHKCATLGSDNGTRVTCPITRKYLTDITPNLLMPCSFQVWWDRCSKTNYMTLINTEESFLIRESPSSSLAALWRPRTRLQDQTGVFPARSIDSQLPVPFRKRPTMRLTFNNSRGPAHLPNHRPPVKYGVSFRNCFLPSIPPLAAPSILEEH